MSKEKKYCKICGKELSARNKSGYCVIHKGELYKGENNPFYGKKHSKKTIDLLKEKCKIASEKLWLNDEYRSKVISSVTGLKRNEDFKNTQKLNALKQFEDPKQKEIRSIKMKESWENGLIVKNNNISLNKSKQENDFITNLKNKLSEEILTKETIHYINEDKNKWLFPDAIIPKYNIIIEYNGSFWHADPNRYVNGNDLVHDNIKAKDIWERDKEKENIYKSLGYNVITIWGDYYINNKEKCINETIEKINKIIWEHT